jgi:hypothetical protein
VITGSTILPAATSRKEQQLCCQPGNQPIPLPNPQSTQKLVRFSRECNALMCS